MPVAVVTGAAGRIGTSLVRALEEDGWTVAGLDLPEACPAGDPRFRGIDLTDAGSIRSVLADVLAEHRRIDLLVNNAGVSAIGAFTDHDVRTHAEVMAVNHLGAVACTQAALPALVASNGRVVVIGSVAGFAPVLGRPAYVASKHAVTGLFEALRPELASLGVGVTLVHPTFVAGGMGEAASRAEGARRSTTGADLSPDEVATAIVEGVRTGRDRILVGRTAHLSWHLNRLFPRTYVKLMTRRLAR